MRTFIAALLLFSASTAAAASKDEDAVKGRVAEFIALFNKGDAKAMTAYLTEDAVLVNPIGTKGAGVAEIEAIFKHDSATILKGAAMDMKVVEFRAAGKDAAWVEIEHSVKGAHTPDGKTMDAVFHVPCLFVKKGKTWLLAEARPYAFLPTPPATAAK